VGEGEEGVLDAHRAAVGAAQPVLEGINLTIAPNQIVANTICAAMTLTPSSARRVRSNSTAIFSVSIARRGIMMLSTTRAPTCWCSRSTWFEAL